MKYLSLIGFVFLVSLDGIFAQRENIWILGKYGLDVSSSMPLPQLMNAQLFAEASASACDENGQLLFYTDGSYVWDRDHNLMPNGSELTPLPGNVTGSSTQGTCIIPIPGQEQQYFVFSLISVEFGSDAGKLYYSKVDMTLNGGKGDVVSGEKAIYLSDGLTEKMIAITGTHCNIWLIVCSRIASEFKSFEITAAGVQHIPVVSTGGIINFNLNLLGTLTPSPDKTKILSAAAHPGGGGLELFDFDQVTGELSNPTVIDTSEAFYSACFSPDQSKIYAIKYRGTGNVYQYALNVANPYATKSLIRQEGWGFRFDKIKLAANGRIYLRGGQNYLDGIDFPNLSAPACGFSTQAITFDADISGSLPNITPIFAQGPDAFSSVHVNGPCWGVNFQIHADAQGWDYQSNGSHEGPIIQVDTPGTYWLSYYTSPCQYHVDTFQVSFPNGVLPTVQAYTACRAHSNGFAFATTYPADPVEYSYTWIQGTDTLSLSDTLSNVRSGDYRVHIQTNTGCDTTLYFHIPEEDFRVSFQLSDTLICIGEAVEIANTSDTHFNSYHWALEKENRVIIPDTPYHTFTENGIYRLQLIGEGPVCTDTATQTIIVDPLPTANFRIEPKMVCAGEAVYLSLATDSTTIQLNWEIENQLWSEREIRPKYQHAFANSGTFPITLTVQSRACPDTSYTDTIRVYPFPEVDLGTDSSLCLQGQPIYLKNLRNAPSTPYHQVWSTGDTTDILKVVHPGIYTLSVTTEPVGCTTTETIVIEKDCYVDIPNAFTPNGDGHNDFFLPRLLLSDGLTHFHMHVFNRWGEVVFETQRPDGRGWDGRLNGKAQPSGVYLYRIEAGFSDGRQEKYEGNVTLLR